MTQISYDDRAHRQYLFGPLVDFLCLGGGSLLLAVIALAFRPTLATGAASSILSVPLFVSILLNFPHFINSYQIFYERFGQRITAKSNPLRLRYIFAGIVVPLALVLIIAGELVFEDSTGVLIFGSLYFFLTYWHYAKQGYGIFIVETVLNRQFFEGWEKQLLLVNSYVVFLVAWCITSSRSETRELIGKSIKNIAMPEMTASAAWIILALSSCCVFAMLFRRIKDGKPVAIIGAISYFTTYAWLFLDINEWFFIFPAAHSLQYLTVVWRFKLNEIESRSRNPVLSFLVFVAIGILGGIIAFIGFPFFLETFFGYDQDPRTAGLFFFFIPIFINIHHFFIDNVIWRHENKEVSHFLMKSTR